jgi:thiosulfate/3-mercaptopyruvate sulfurtransferase
MSGNLVSTAWLAGQRNVAVLDASWHLPATGRNAKQEFLDGHIPGARFFDIDAISDTETTLPHMLPKPKKFAACMGKLGIGNDIMVVAYDAAGLFSAARAWWMFKVFGHDKVAVLDGGLPKWKADGRPLDSGAPAAPAARIFTGRYNAAMVKSLADVAAGNAQIADARSPSRFAGAEPEPRPGVRPGHMPGAANVHYAKLLNSDFTLKPKPDLAALFAAAGIDTGKPVITSCGSGVTAAILSLALTELGAKSHALYDGSWAEWGAAEGAKVVTGP